jgi:hypothetical protein
MPAPVKAPSRDNARCQPYFYALDDGFVQGQFAWSGFGKSGTFVTMRAAKPVLAFQ